MISNVTALSSAQGADGRDDGIAVVGVAVVGLCVLGGGVGRTVGVTVGVIVVGWAVGIGVSGMYRVDGARVGVGVVGVAVEGEAVRFVVTPMMVGEMVGVVGVTTMGRCCGGGDDGTTVSVKTSVLTCLSASLRGSLLPVPVPDKPPLRKTATAISIKQIIRNVPAIRIVMRMYPRVVRVDLDPPCCNTV